MNAVTLRPAGARDVLEITNLINGFAAEAVMLPCTYESVSLALDDFVVAVDASDRVLACGALKEYSPSLAEVASVAVSREMHGRGLGRAIVSKVEELARLRGIPELFALTMTPGFFEAGGYKVAERARYPEKLRRDCMGCPRKFGCNEICVGRVLPASAYEVAA